MNAALSARALAEATAQAIFARVTHSRALGIRIVGVAPGHALLKMQVRKDMLDSRDHCQLGVVWSLADSAFQFASNSYNIKTVTAASSIEHAAPAHAGETLTAVAMEQERSGETGVYDVVVSKGDGTRVARFRGTSRQIQGEILSSLAP
jgi:acyl-CoA thioesterase